MNRSILEDAIRSATETEEFIRQPGAVSAAAAFFLKRFPGKSALIVSVSDVWDRYGESAVRSFRDSGVPLQDSLVFRVPPPFHAEYAHIETVRSRLAEGDAIPVSFGSGTINDIVKRASFEAGRRYACVATAASVDGYTSAGAAILVDGFKKTLDCPAPAGIFADPAILAAAPPYLTSSGFGDLAGKLVAGADWLFADAAGAESIDPFAYRLVQGSLRDLLSKPAEVRAGNPDAVIELFEGLAITGFSMQYMKSSRPVSGCEHLFSHVWEMEGVENPSGPSTHGWKVAVGTLAATAITEVALRIDESGIDPAAARRLPDATEREGQVRRAFKGSGAAPAAVEEAVRTALAKLDPGQAERRLASLREGWSALREKVAGQLMPYADLREMLSEAGCPVTAEGIGVSRQEAFRTAFRAQMLRDRYTVLDFLYDLGTLEACVGSALENASYLR